MIVTDSYGMQFKQFKNKFKNKSFLHLDTRHTQPESAKKLIFTIYIRVMSTQYINFIDNIWFIHGFISADMPTIHGTIIHPPTTNIARTQFIRNCQVK